MGNLLHLSPHLSVADTLTARRPDWSKPGPSVMHNSTAFLPQENGGDELDITSFGCFQGISCPMTAEISCQP